MCCRGFWQTCVFSCRVKVISLCPCLSEVLITCTWFSLCQCLPLWEVLSQIENASLCMSLQRCVCLELHTYTTYTRYNAYNFVLTWLPPTCSCSPSRLALGPLGGLGYGQCAWLTQLNTAAPPLCVCLVSLAWWNYVGACCWCWFCLLEMHLQSMVGWLGSCRKVTGCPPARVQRMGCLF